MDELDLLSKVLFDLASSMPMPATMAFRERLAKLQKVFAKKLATRGM
jgi:hypothetical protein